MGSLKPAHKGYRYQDISTAYFLIKLLIGYCDRVVVDKKQFTGDKFDDLTVFIGPKKIRRQFKHSSNDDRCLTEDDFIKTSSSLCIDTLLNTYINDDHKDKEYRLCVTWKKPTDTDNLIAQGLLTKVKNIPSFENSSVNFFKLNAQKIWPKDHRSIWELLHPNSTDRQFTRSDFIKFCDSFLIEVGLPQFSKSIDSPGELEQLVTFQLKEYVGIGKYPNAGRRESDVLGLSISLANEARTMEATLSHEEVAKYLEIRMDLGRVSQSFPIDKSRLIDRISFRSSLKECLKKDGFHIITASPGSGKSWEMTLLKSELSSSYVTASHYCYLEPGDEDVERRVTTDVFWANVISEIKESILGSSGENSYLYADINSFEKALSDAATHKDGLVILLDGLDHIARVKKNSDSLSDNETDIIERLASIELPKNVKVVIASQPGMHLSPLQEKENVFSYELPLWEPSELNDLAKTYDLYQSLIQIELGEDKSKLFLNDLIEKCEGNPLYATYLFKSLLRIINDSPDIDVELWLEASPKINGNIELYYSRIYKNLKTEAHSIAIMFGLLDFSVNREELQQILPAIVHPFIPKALTEMLPILVNVTGQGGYRIYHESFRRFILDKIDADGHQLSDFLSPVVDWLKQLGFYQSSKSFRFLLPLLRRSKKHTEIFKQIDYSYVSKSISYGFNVDAIQKNLVLTAQVAGDDCNWPVLIRCTELSRSLYTSFEENLPVHYWVNLGKVFGANFLAKRLLFDGKTTLDAECGLLACSFIDDANETAPWSEYLEIYSPDDYESSSYRSSEIDTSSQLNSFEESQLPVIHGRLKTGRFWSIFRRFFKYLTSGKNFHFYFSRKIAMRFSRMGYMDSMKNLLNRLDDLGLHQEGFSIRLGIADELRRVENFSASKEILLEGLKKINTIDVAIATLDFGVFSESNLQLKVDINEIDLVFDRLVQQVNVRQWVKLVRLHAHLGNKEILEGELERIEGDGWYRCWLHFVLMLAEAEAVNNNGKKDFDICTIFKILEGELNPFVGNPRACDLYSVHEEIHESILRGLLLVQEEDWEAVLNTLIKLRENLSTYLDREDGGPFDVSSLLTLLQPYIKKIPTKSVSLIQKLINSLEDRGTYYSTHSEYAVELGLIYKQLGDNEKANEIWQESGQYLAAYGFRKDVTIFGLIETVGYLKKKSKETALEAIERLQKLVHTVLYHTDRRETKHAPSAWFRALLEIDTAAAVNVLSETLVEDDFEENWITVSALKSVIRHVSTTSNPLVTNALFETLPVEIDYEDSCKKEVENRLKVIEKLLSVDKEYASLCLSRLNAYLDNDTLQHTFSALNKLQDFAKHHLIQIPPQITTKTEDREDSFFRTQQKAKIFQLPGISIPLFPKVPSYVDLLSSIRKASELMSHDDISTNRQITLKVNIFLSYKLHELYQESKESEAIRLIYFYAREMNSLLYSLEHVEELGKMLETAGLTELAVNCYGLAYSNSRGGTGWYNMGDDSHSSMLREGIKLDGETLNKVLASEVAYKLGGTLGYGMGMLQGVITYLSEVEKNDDIESSWNEAFDVIAHRLPLEHDRGWFANYDVKQSTDLTLDEQLVLLLMMRVSEPVAARKKAAIYGVSKIVKAYPQLVINPLKKALTTNTPVTSIQLLFHVLLLSEEEPFSITQSLLDLLEAYADCNSWVISLLSKMLMQRVNEKDKVSFENIPFVEFSKRDRDEIIFFADEGGALNAWTEVFSDLPEIVDAELKRFFKVSNFENRIRERHKTAYGRNDGRDHPSVQVLKWEFEIFNSILQEKVSGKKLVSSEQDFLSFDDELLVLKSTEPNLNVHQALYEARIARPSISKPSEQQPGFCKQIKVESDGQYEGWLQIALVEEEFVFDGHSFNATKIVTNFSGISVWNNEKSIPKNFIPFVQGNAENWWNLNIDTLKLYRPESLPAICLERRDDWLDDCLVLIPPIELFAISGINLITKEKSFVWLDEHQNPLVVSRCWEVPKDSIDADRIILSGSDLIIRPDIYELIQGRFEQPFGFFTRIFSKNLSS